LFGPIIKTLEWLLENSDKLAHYPSFPTILFADTDTIEKVYMYLFKEEKQDHSKFDQYTKMTAFCVHSHEDLNIFSHCTIFNVGMIADNQFDPW